MPAEDDLIEAAPCPNCRSPLTVAVADLGHLVECPGCGTQFRARRPGSAAGPATGPAASPPPPPRREERREERRDDRDDEEDDGRPRRSAARDGRDRYDEPERDRDRRSGRDGGRYYDDDDDRYETRRRPRRSSAATGLGVVNLVYAGLVLLCGCGSVFLSFWVKELIDNAPGGPPPGVKRADIDFALKLLLIAGGVYILGSGLFLAAGLTTLKQSPSGRTLTYMCIAFSFLAVGFQVVSLVIGAADGDLGENPQQLCGVVLALIAWIGYIITAFILLAKSAPRNRGYRDY